MVEVLRRVAWVLVLGALAACEPEPRAADWRLVFDDPTLAARAVTVEARILEGGCAGTEVYAEVLTISGGGMQPPVLGPGTVGLAGRARDGDCTWFADGCLPVELPRAAGAVVEVVLEASDVEELACEGECVAGACPEPDAGPADAGPDDGGSPVDTGPRPDGAPGGVVPSNIGGSIAPGTGLADIRIDTAWVFDADDGSIDSYPLPDRSATATPIRAATGGVDAGIRFEAMSQGGGGGEVGVFTMESLTVTGTIVGVGGRPLVLIVGGAVEIGGGAVVGADFLMGERHAGPGGGAPGRGAMSGGGGPGGGGEGRPSVDGGGGDDGGGGGSFGGPGGGGGSILGGDGGGGTPGVVYGDATLVPLVGGSGGGGGGSYDGEGDGGAGAGALQITAGASIAVGGYIDACGAGGKRGVFMGSGGRGGGAGGGGSGGAVLLEAPTVTLVGRIGANGGAGGQGNTNAGMPGMHGARGFYATAPVAGTPTVSFGGGGGDGSDANGVAGDVSNAGGAGGAGGRVRINDSTGDRAAFTSNVLPSSTALFTVGTVTLAP